MAVRVSISKQSVWEEEPPRSLLRAPEVVVIEELIEESVKKGSTAHQKTWCELSNVAIA